MNPAPEVGWHELLRRLPWQGELHIEQFATSGDNRIENGLLLRADLHILFDMRLLRVHPDSLRIDLHDALRQSSYAELHGQTLCACVDRGHPERAALQARWDAPVEGPGGQP